MKVEAYLWTRKNAENKYPIKIRITENRKSTFIPINYAINKSHWNPKTHRVRETYSEHQKINELIKNKIKEIEHTKSIAKPIKKISNNLSFFDYFENYIVELFERNKFGTYKKHKVILKHLKTFVLNKYGKEDLLFDDIDRGILENLRTYFIRVPLLESTQNGYFKKIKHLYYEAIKANQFLPALDPFTSFDNPSSKATNKSLTLNELVSIEIFNPFQYDFISINASANKLFDMKNSFLFQIYMRGIRVSDLIFLKWCNINNRKIEYTMRKTNQSISIPINEKLIYILRLYMPFELKKQYLREGNYGDKEMFYSLSENEKNIIVKRVKKTNYYDKFNDYSYQYEIKSIDKLLNKYNHLSTNPKYKNQYIFNLLKPSQIEKLDNSSKQDIKKIEYDIIQSATTLYNKDLKLINKFIRDENGQVIQTIVTSHLARHSYASIGVKLGFDVLTISKSLGHKDLKTTQAYLNTLDTDFVDEENSRLFETLGAKSFSHFEKTKGIVIINKSDAKKINK